MASQHNVASGPFTFLQQPSSHAPYVVTCAVGRGERTSTIGSSPGRREEALDEEALQDTREERIGDEEEAREREDREREAAR